MLQASRSRKRTHFEPESKYLYPGSNTTYNTALQDQKDELLLILTDYLGKIKTKDETLARLSDVETVCQKCEDAI